MATKLQMLSKNAKKIAINKIFPKLPKSYFAELEQLQKEQLLEGVNAEGFNFPEYASEEYVDSKKLSPKTGKNNTWNLRNTGRLHKSIKISATQKIIKIVAKRKGDEGEDVAENFRKNFDAFGFNEKTRKEMKPETVFQLKKKIIETLLQ